MATVSLSALALSILAGAPAILAAPAGPVPARNDIDPAERPGERPYEMVWADRAEPRPPLVDFEDLTGWTIEGLDGAVATLARSREQTVWGNAVAKLVYRGESDRSRVRIRVPSPISIPRPFDSIDLWCYGNNWGWVPDATTPQVRLFAILRSGDGREIDVLLTNVRWKEWWLVHERIPRETIDALGAEPRLAGLAISGAANREDRVLYFDSLSFYEEPLPPLSFQPRPRRNLALFPGQDPGLNTGPGTLPFPTREETILPANLCAAYENDVREEAPGRFVLSYRGDDARIRYELDLSKPDFTGLAVLVDGERVLRPLAGAGVSIDGATGPGRTGAARIREGAIEWIRTVPVAAGGEVEIAHAVRIRQKSLVIDAIARGGRATEFRFGRMEDLRDPELIAIPYLTYGGSNPPVLLEHDPRGRAVFATVWPDWYRSNGSEPYANPGLEDGGRAARVHGGVRYIAKTDGRRNDLFERAFLTVSPVYEEVLPVIPNPPSPHAMEAGSRLWQESWGPGDFDKEHERSRRLRAYGIEKLTQCNHEIAWRDGGESFTLRLRAAPKKGGDEALKRYVARQQSLGWRSGLYTNYTDFAPVNEYWDPDCVQRMPDGEWRAAWPRCYALKPSRAVEFDRKLAPQIQAKYGSNAAYTDVHTAVAPWGYCDFDARVPGAGTFAQTFYLYGELLLHDRSVYGPTWSEGTYQWLYAGLASGNYGLCYSGANLSQFPLLPVFDLREIHPKECDIGVPWTGGFFGGGDWASAERIDRSIDQFIATTIAYGHIGWLVEEGHGIRRTCRSYYQLQALQSRYAQAPVRSIRYADPRDGRLATVSEALAKGFWRSGRLAIEYENGLRISINGNADGAWAVEGAVLPPWGWIAVAEGFRSGVVIERGTTMDVVACPEYLYIDGRGADAEIPEGLRARGGAALRREGEGCELIDIGGNDWIGFTRKPGVVRATAWSADGEELGPAEIRTTERWHWLEPVAKGVRYEIAWSGTGEPAPAIEPKDPVALRPPLAAAPIRREALLPRAAIDVAVWAEGDPEIAASGPAWLSIEPKTFRTGPGGLVKLALAEREVPGDKGGEIVLRAGDASVALPFAIERVRPVAIDLLSARLPLAWTTIIRGGSEKPGDEATGACFRRDACACGGVTKPSFFSHPPYHGGVGLVRGVLGPFAMPAEPSVLELSVGIRDGGDVSDGVVFTGSIRAFDGGDWEEVFRVHANRPGWTPIARDLSKWAGKRVLLRLQADVGPADNSNSDWAAWGAPAIRLREAVTRITFATKP
ncbi:MAG: hypothetical protein JXP34_24955 [Planctomycetes bacterium]|nr:hypothetical protein [Planctomycetota bacterium]